VKLRTAVLLLICAALCGCTSSAETIVITHSPPETAAAAAAVSLPPETDAPMEAVQADPEEEIAYVLNTSSKKFHLPDCASVRDMKEKNRRDVTAGRSEIIDDGYTPCKRCNP